MGARTSGREAALQILFAIDASGTPKETAIEDFWRQFPGDAEGRPYADDLVSAIVSERTELDRVVTEKSARWRVERMTPLDRNILRLGAHELLHRPDVPFEVIIDEAVELAKRYGSEQSPAFINGVLASLAATHRSAT